MVLVEGQNADGVTIEEREFAVDADVGSATDRLVAVVREVREAAAATGNKLTSVGVTWTDESGAHALCEALASYEVGEVAPISPFIAATTLTQAVGLAIGYARIAMLFVEAESVTMAVVETAEAAIAEIRDESLESVDVMTAVRVLVEWTEGLSSPPDGVFVVGSGVDIVSIKRELENTTSLPVSGPEEPETALARGAALASANGSLPVLATDAFAYARDAVEGGPDAVTLSRLEVSTMPADAERIDDDTDVATTAIATSEPAGLHQTPQRRPVLMLGSLVTLIAAIVALEVSLALGIRPAAVGLRHIPGPARIMSAPLMPLAPLVVALAPRPAATRPVSPVAQLPPPNSFAPLPGVMVPGDGPGAGPALAGPPLLMPNPAPVRAPDADYPNYPLPLPLPVASTPSAAPIQQPSVPVTQPVTSQPVTTAPVTSVPITTAPATTVPVTQPPTYVPVSQPPRPVPVAPPTVHAPETQPPVNLPVPEGPVVPGLETPTVHGPVIEVPTIAASPGIAVPAQDMPSAAPQSPGSLTAPAQEAVPSIGGSSAGSTGTGPSATGGGSAGAESGSLGGGSVGGGSVGGGSVGGGSSSIGGSSSSGGSSSVGGSSSSGGGSSSTGGSSSGSGSVSSGGGSR
ncbi:MAG: hypothetical protein K2X97_20565 [Mycobacteriaceae bacterium]|nr:hypothetical protein [Mycobacteriaceae bacterium]